MRADEDDHDFVSYDYGHVAHSTRSELHFGRLFRQSWARAREGPDRLQYRKVLTKVLPVLFDLADKRAFRFFFLRKSKLSVFLNRSRLLPTPASSPTEPKAEAEPATVAPAADTQNRQSRRRPTANPGAAPAKVWVRRVQKVSPVRSFCMANRASGYMRTEDHIQIVLPATCGHVDGQAIVVHRILILSYS